MIQRHYLSEQAIKRLQAKIRAQLAGQQHSIRPDLAHLRREVAELDRQIDAGAIRVFSAPERLLGSLYAKLDELQADRNRLSAQLETAERQRDATSGEDEQKVHEVIEALRDLRETLRKACPAEVRELLSKTASRIELHFAHERTGRLFRNPFDHGTIFIRPEPTVSRLGGNALSSTTSCCSCRGPPWSELRSGPRSAEPCRPPPKS